MKKIILLLLILILIFSCDDLFTRFDPMEAGRNIFTLEEFNFYTGPNPVLNMNTSADIDQENMKFSIILPPSLDTTATPLEATFRIKESGIDGGWENNFQINKNWNDGEKLILDRNEFDSTQTWDTSFVNEYTLEIKKEFLCRLILTSGNYYSSSPDFPVQLRFNDLAEPVFDPPTLDVVDFMNGLNDLSGNFDTPVEADFIPTLPVASNTYDWTLHATAEGLIKVKLDAGSVLTSTNLTQNIESNKLTMVYDAQTPILPTPIIMANVTASDLDLLIITDDYQDAVLSLEFNESTDLLTPQDKLLYSFYFSDAAGDVTGTAATVTTNGFELYYQGQKDVPYQAKYTWNFVDMPQDMKDRLINGTTLFFNVIVQDMASNMILYTNATLTYFGPNYP